MVEFGTFKDERDGYVYKTVKIGNQVWFAENFRYECAGSVVYGNDEGNLEKYGRLYEWRTAMNVAPDGWRLPSMGDWNELTWFAGRKEAGGKALKSREGWNNDGNGTDEYGFGALPGGYYGSYNRFHGVGSYGYWQSSTYLNEYSFALIMYFNEESHVNECFKSCMFSVRFLRC